MWASAELGGDFAASPQGYGRPTYNDKRAAEPPATQERSRRDWRKEGKRPAQQKATDAQAIPARTNLHTNLSGRSSIHHEPKERDRRCWPPGQHRERRR
eukprot:529461-Prymnesium_polylepis.1